MTVRGLWLAYSVHIHQNTVVHLKSTRFCQLYPKRNGENAAEGIVHHAALEGEDAEAGTGSRREMLWRHGNQSGPF